MCRCRCIDSTEARVIDGNTIRVHQQEGQSGFLSNPVPRNNLLNPTSRQPVERHCSIALALEVWFRRLSRAYCRATRVDNPHQKASTKSAGRRVELRVKHVSNISKTLPTIAATSSLRKDNKRAAATRIEKGNRGKAQNCREYSPISRRWRYKILVTRRHMR
jgi:hypothetical protein